MHHFVNKVKSNFRKQMAATFRIAEIAYNSMDFTGIGYITEEDLLNSKVIKKLKFPVEDVKLYFKYASLFNNSDGGTNPTSPDAKKVVIPVNGMSFDNFKKAFFP